MMVSSRIAPTPSGYLHIGNLYSFLLTWAIVRKQQGKLQLRIDDLDTARVRSEYVADIFETLEFIGIQYDSGPKDTAGFFHKYSQQFRVAEYEGLLLQLVKTGLVYACTCSRKSSAQNNKDTDPCLDKKLALATPGAAWRIHVPTGTAIQFYDGYLGSVSVDLNKAMPDFIVKRKDGIPSYQVASLYDDTLFNINCIVRGEDLLTSTAAQLYLAQLIDNSAFLNTTFYHHAVITDNKHKKLSKSRGSQSIRTLRETGKQAVDILEMLRGLPGFIGKRNLENIGDILENFELPSSPSETGIIHISAR
jgi:glutamyl/glutaminyl-tRNA synthetase